MTKLPQQVTLEPSSAMSVHLYEDPAFGEESPGVQSLSKPCPEPLGLPLGPPAGSCTGAVFPRKGPVGALQRELLTTGGLLYRGGGAWVLPRKATLVKKDAVLKRVRSFRWQRGPIASFLLFPPRVDFPRVFSSWRCVLTQGGRPPEVSSRHFDCVEVSSYSSPMVPLGSLYAVKNADGPSLS